MIGACCAPGDERHDDAPGRELESVPSGAGTHPDTLVDVPATTFRMGDDCFSITARIVTASMREATKARIFTRST